MCQRPALVAPIGTLTGHNYTDRQGGRQSSNLVTLAGVYTATNNLIFDGRYSRGFLNEKNGNYFVPETVQIFSCTTLPTHPTFPCSTTARKYHYKKRRFAPAVVRLFRCLHFQRRRTA